VFRRSELDKPVVATLSAARDLIANPRGYFASPIGLATTWSQLVKNTLRSEIYHGAAISTLEDLAGSFEVCSQTLRRRLRREGASYRKLKQEARQEVAVDVLSRRKATVADASYAAGFAEATALTRALKATRGMSSRELRDQVGRWRLPKREYAAQAVAKPPRESHHRAWRPDVVFVGDACPVWPLPGEPGRLQWAGSCRSARRSENKPTRGR
jgi:AraC-like DNA-binding protein